MGVCGKEIQGSAEEEAIGIGGIKKGSAALQVYRRDGLNGLEGIIWYMIIAKIIKDSKTNYPQSVLFPSIKENYLSYYIYIYI